MQPTPINIAEAIIEPFWDPQISGLSRWQVEGGGACGLKVEQNWCWAAFEWTRKPLCGPALRMSRAFDLDVAGYSHLMVSVMAPQDSIFRMSAETDRGHRTFTSPPAPALKKEYLLDLQGAEKLGKVTLEIEAREEGIASGWFNWVGLQNASLLERHRSQWNRFDAEWEAYLKPESFEPVFAPAWGLLINREEIEALRAGQQDIRKLPFVQAGIAASSSVPESLIGDFVNFGGDTRYCRERDYGRILIGQGVNAAIAGLLLKDKSLLRLGARYAMSLAFCGRWDDGMICYFPGGAFEHRCFVQSLCVHEIALLLDLAGEMFTEAGHDYLLRRIAEEGLGSINFNTWKHDCIFHCNQLAWFSPGRMIGCAVLEKWMPRVRPYLDLTYQDLIENLDNTILPDGGYMEGPSYFRCVGRDGGLSLYYYARARGSDFASIVPDSMKRTAGFAAALISTDRTADVIPICDASPMIEQENAAVMAALLPESQWTTLFHRALRRTEGLPATVLTWQLMRSVPEKALATQAFVSLPEMGIMASTRDLAGEKVKLFIMGNKARAGHTHEDKGSFVLEFAGDTFAMDPGTCDYSSPIADLVKNCERHNMLVPAGMPERPHPLCPLPVGVKPEGRGDTVAFCARIDAAPGWESYYRRWVRSWDSPSPDRLTIRDEYALSRGDAVEFYWNTCLKPHIEGRTVTIRGKRGTAVLEIPAGCSVRLDTLPLLGGDRQNRIVVRKESPEGVLEIRVRLTLC
ncbi:MAG: heparinase II/III family protein [Armatimonadetes bacterium]|nr:heparinase II/III family protein [Armatimonadota bacterium]